MFKLLPAGMGVLAAGLMLTACTGSALHAGRVSAGRVSAAQCARAEGDIRDTARLVAPLSGVTTSRSLIAAARRMRGPTGRVIRFAIRARSKSGHSSSISLSFADKSPVLVPPPLSGEVRRVYADEHVFGDALAAYGNSQAGAKAVGDAAQKAMRDIQAVRATCASKPR